MRVSLTPHPETPGPDLSITVEVGRPRRSSLELRYVVTGDISRLVVPGWVKRSRADELWRTTCFEAFIRTDDGAYFEFNLSPSGRWAAYRFSDYRDGMTPDEGAELRDAVRHADGARLEYSAILDLDRSGLPVDRPWRVGLSTVIEDIDGGISWWALAHPSDKPDFHHPDSFVLEIL